MSRNAGSDENCDSAKFRQLTWRFLCKLHQQRWAWRVGEFDDFGDFYANYVLANLTITRDGSNVLANLANLRFLCKLHHQRWANVLVNLKISAISITSRVEAEQQDMYFLRYISRDGLTCFANLTIWAISVTSWVGAEQQDIYFLRYISRDGLTCWRIWRFGRFLLHHEWGPSRKIYIFFVH